MFRTSAGRKRPLASRLMGMETEYATVQIAKSRENLRARADSRTIYEQLREAIRSDQPTLRGIFDTEQDFLASGGAVSFESTRSVDGVFEGLIELATPEVRGPGDLLACQRSLDDLVASCAATLDTAGDVRILKNSSDAAGHLYGCQENYEATVAFGPWLIIYRLAIVLLWAMQGISLILALPVLATAVASARVIRASRGRSLSERPEDLFESLPRFFRRVLALWMKIIHFPTGLLLGVVARRIAFRRQRKYLTALLVSRVCLCGTGDLSDDGRYRLSAKAMATDTLSGIGLRRRQRPIYTFGHWWNQLCAASFLSIGVTRGLLRKKQRLQIALSDSNLSEWAEYVKLGSVSLVLDMIESGATTQCLRLKHPIKALHAITADWNLVRRVQTNRGKMSALEIQKRYLQAAETFVQATEAKQRGESEQVIDRWRDLLEAASAYRKEAQNVTPAVGRLDWLSKRWLIDQLGSEASLDAKKKVDLRYHELSPDGYYIQIASNDPSLSLVHPDLLMRRRRMPPSNSPAAKRGRLIREFGTDANTASVDWDHALLGKGKRARRIRYE